MCEYICRLDRESYSLFIFFPRAAAAAPAPPASPRIARHLKCSAHHMFSVVQSAHARARAQVTRYIKVCVWSEFFFCRVSWVGWLFARGRFVVVRLVFCSFARKCEHRAENIVYFASIAAFAHSQQRRRKAAQ